MVELFAVTISRDRRMYRHPVGTRYRIRTPHTRGVVRRSRILVVSN
jgi:hypothetical protein